MTTDEAVALIADRLSAGEFCPAAGICLLLLRGCPWDAVDDAWTWLSERPATRNEEGWGPWWALRQRRVIKHRRAVGSVVADVDEAIRRATDARSA